MSCECGCGGDPGTYTKTHPKLGYVKGAPRRFVKNHHFRGRQNGADNPAWKGGRRINARGYVLILKPDHPDAHADGLIFEHRLIAEAAFGRPVPATADVHHVNGDPSDNRPANLVVCQDRTYHSLLHLRARALRETGDPNKRLCTFCKQYDDAGLLQRRPGKNAYVHPACHRAYHRDYYRRRGKR